MTIIRTTEPQGTFRVTYETVSVESAEQGDYAEIGYLDWQGCPVDNYYDSEWDFRDLVDKLSGHLAEGDGARVPRWVTVDPQSDFWLSPFWRDIASDPNETLGVSASVHRPDWITDASWLRVCRVLGWRQR
jgi:hypothetical protein